MTRPLALLVLIACGFAAATGLPDVVATQLTSHAARSESLRAAIAAILAVALATPAIALLALITRSGQRRANPTDMRRG